MSRSYRHIKQYKEEIYRLKSEGLSHRAIGERLGFSKEQVKGFVKRCNREKNKHIDGKELKQVGRPCKKEGELPPSIQRLDKLAQMRYVLASKDRYIKRLEMENELMRDFLSLTERK